MKQEEGVAGVPPVEKSVSVRLTVEEAFRRFTTDIASWWPLSTHSVGQNRAETVVFETRRAGRIYERIQGGETATWGRVLEWDPPRHFAMSWHPGREPDTAQRVDVRFEAQAHGTDVVIVHTGWEALADEARETRESYDRGWEPVLDRFVGAA